MEHLRLSQQPQHKPSGKSLRVRPQSRNSPPSIGYCGPTNEVSRIDAFRYEQVSDSVFCCRLISGWPNHYLYYIACCLCCHWASNERYKLASPRSDFDFSERWNMSQNYQPHFLFCCVCPMLVVMLFHIRGTSRLVHISPMKASPKELFCDISC